MTRIAFLMAAALGFSVTTASAQTTNFYSADGRHVGSATTIGGTTNFYSADGRHLATSSTSGSTTRFYGADGRSIGSASTPSTGSFGRSLFKSR